MSTIKKLLIANRGEIACRIISTARRLGIKTVAVYSDADARALHAEMADEAVHIGASEAAKSYIREEAILDAIKKSGADAVHPGYGFLSERADFARLLESEGVIFVAPPADAIDAMGDKITSKRIAAEAGVSIVPGVEGVPESPDAAVAAAKKIGYPVMLKASAGGGGKGMRIAHNDAEVREGLVAAQNEARSSFGDDRVFMEKFITAPRHIEIQILGDAHGNTVYLGERECSIQRRHQKVIEEAPSPFLDAKTRAAMGEQAVALARQVGYHSAGTVEFIVDGERNFYFLEMNTRLQVEHPVTELITGLDLVEWMLRVAEGAKLPFTQKDIKLKGWAVESRIYAEDPFTGFLPSTGRLTRYRPPQSRQGDTTLRNDTGVREGDEISRFYDPMVAKFCTHAPTRDAAIDAMGDALDRYELEGIGHNLPFLQAVMAHPRFRKGDINTGFIEDEFPDGFHGTPLAGEVANDWAALAIAAQRADDAMRLGGDGGGITAGDDYIVVTPDGEEITPKGRVETGWHIGEGLMTAKVDGRAYHVRIARQAGSIWQLRGGGRIANLRVIRASLAPLLAHLPESGDGAAERKLISPMPGLLTALHVKEGDVVEAGQTLATLEAMKMENLLRATRKVRIAAIHAKAGDSLPLGGLIMEFEADE